MNKIALSDRLSQRPELSLDQYISLISPAQMNDIARLTYWDGIVAQKIKSLETTIETLQAYQQMLYDRAQEIVRAPWHQELHLTRRKNCATGKITYHLQLLKTYDVAGIAPEIMEETTFPGPERHKAITAFKAAQKTHPGITAEMAIEKSPWE